MKKIVIASDSFKGSLTSMQVAESTEKGILGVFPGCEVIKLAAADGGEGTAEAIVAARGGYFVPAAAHDPLMREITAAYGVTEGGRAAVIDTAAASGLYLLDEKERNPLTASTYGTGEIIRRALEAGCRRIILGTGGSATNDAGTGLLQALGYKFLDTCGKNLGYGGKILGKIESISGNEIMAKFPETEFIVAYDVSNPFFGPEGSSHIYGPQKGADASTAEELDRGMEHFAGVLERAYGIKVNDIAGSGSAGGTAGTLHAVLGAKLMPGARFVLDAAGLKKALKGADLVITGEGRIDAQTLSGKVPSEVLKFAREAGVPAAVVAGAVEDREQLEKAGFALIRNINDGYSGGGNVMDATTASLNIEHTVAAMMRDIGKNI